MAAFIKAYPSGRYAGKAKTIFDNRLRGEAKWTPRTRTAPFFLGAADAVSRSEENAAKADMARPIQAEVEKICNGFVEAAGSRLKASSATSLEWECQTIGGGAVCSVTGSAACAVEELEEDRAEHCVLPAR